MSENQAISLGGKKPENQINNPIQQSGDHLPQEFIDNEFIVPTDEIPLPSEGRWYPNGQKTVKIRYLTAEDENILTSPDLIRSGKVLDILLENSIIDKSLSPDVMLTGDRNAVLLSLRSTGYGDDYPIKMSCHKCSHEYETSIKLSELKYKKNTVEFDANGEFEVTLPKVKAVLKFRLLNGRDEAYLSKNEGKAKKIKAKVQFSTALTEKYLLQVMEYNGNRDKGYIKNAISKMPIFDSLFLREYMKEVEPGVDLEKEFECPSCGEFYVDTIPVTARLFWPNARI